MKFDSDFVRSLKPFIWLVGMALTVVFWVDARFVSSAEYKLFVAGVYYRQDLNERYKLYLDLQAIEAQYGVGCIRCSPETLTRYREIQDRIAEINARIKQQSQSVRGQSDGIH